MGSLDIKGALRRRWYLLVPALLATGGLLAAAVVLMGPTHEVKSSVLLLPPRVAVVGYPTPETPGNPFLRLDGMDPVVSVLVTKLTSEEFSHRMVAGQPGGDYEMVRDPQSQAPIIDVTASGTTDAQAETIRDRILAAMPGTLRTLQADAGVPDRARITLTDLVADPHASESWKGLIRILVLIAGAGIVGTLLLVGAVDAIARSRREAKRAPERAPARQESPKAPQPQRAALPGTAEPAPGKPQLEAERARARDDAGPADRDISTHTRAPVPYREFRAKAR